jgi:hypothetical protein
VKSIFFSYSRILVIIRLLKLALLSGLEGICSMLMTQRLFRIYFKGKGTYFFTEIDITL